MTTSQSCRVKPKKCYSPHKKWQKLSKSNIYCKYDKPGSKKFHEKILRSNHVSKVGFWVNFSINLFIRKLKHKLKNNIDFMNSNQYIVIIVVTIAKNFISFCAWIYVQNQRFITDWMNRGRSKRNRYFFFLLSLFVCWIDVWNSIFSRIFLKIEIWSSYRITFWGILGVWWQFFVFNRELWDKILGIIQFGVGRFP